MSCPWRHSQWLFCHCVRVSHWLRWHHVRVVADYANTLSAWSTTMLTPCPCSQQLRWHRVRVVNDYFSMCPRSQRLCQHVMFENIKLCFYFFDYFFTFSKVVWLRWHDVHIVFDFADMCLRSHWLHWHAVCVGFDYADPMSAFSLTMLTQCQRSHLLRGHTFSRISLRKRNISQNHFCLFIWGPGEVFWSTKVSKISWHCPFKLGFCPGWFQDLCIEI